MEKTEITNYVVKGIDKGIETLCTRIGEYGVTEWNIMELQRLFEHRAEAVKEHRKAMATAAEEALEEEFLKLMEEELIPDGAVPF